MAGTGHRRGSQRRGRRWLAAALAAGVTAGASALPAGSAEAATYRLLVTFEGASLAAGSTVADVSGWGNTGVVRTANGGGIRPTTGRSGAGADYLPAGRSMVDVGDSSSLVVGTADFEWGADVLLYAGDGTDGANVVQKGRYGDRQGQWKLQVDNGRPGCVISGLDAAGSYRRAVLTAGFRIVDGRWHALVCRRTSTQVVLYVDGVARASRSFAPVRLSAGAHVTIGAKAVNVASNDQFRGVLDNVFLRLI